MSTEEPPAFQEAARCDVCKCSFNTFRRRHHCRGRGRTLCHEHSSNQMDLAQFGILSNVRVCADCFNNSTRSEKVESQVSADGVDSVTDKVSRLDIDAEKHPNLEPNTQHQSAVGVIECKCGMPLCICEAPAAKTDPVPMQTKPSSTFTSQLNSKPKKTDAVPKNRGSTSSSKPRKLVAYWSATVGLADVQCFVRFKLAGGVARSWKLTMRSSVFNHGIISNGGVDKPQMDYEVNGEGLREAIKNGDTVAVKKLLSEGVDANYRDKQGMSLLHLAALFNRSDIAFILMDSGASMNYKNAQGETPLDCAPATLQYKMKQKLKESGQQGPHTSV